jgi:hypothetical protein
MRLILTIAAALLFSTTAFGQQCVNGVCTTAPAASHPAATGLRVGVVGAIRAEVEGPRRIVNLIPRPLKHIAERRAARRGCGG